MSMSVDEDLNAHWAANFPGISTIQGLDNIVRYFEKNRIDVFEDRVMVVIFENFAMLAAVVTDTVRKPFPLRYYFETLSQFEEDPEFEEHSRALRARGELTYIAVMFKDGKNKLVHYFGGLACPNPNLN
jgi:hypothetical protein